MARPCKICTADPLVRSRIEALRGSGSSYRQIAELVPGFNVFAIQRHFRHATKAAKQDETLTPLERSEKRLNELSARAEESWLASVATGDARGALDVLKASIRLELDRHARLTEKAETQAETAATNDAPRPEQFDFVVKKVRAAHDEAIKQGAVWCPCGRGPIHPSKLKAFVENQNADNAVN